MCLSCITFTRFQAVPLKTEFMWYRPTELKYQGFWMLITRTRKFIVLGEDASKWSPVSAVLRDKFPPETIPVPFCYGLNCAPQLPKCICSLFPAPKNMTLFGDMILIKVIQLESGYRSQP